MTKQVNIKIANISICLILDDWFSHQVEALYHRFRSDKPAEYILRVNIIDDIPQNRPYSPEVSLRDNRLMITSEEFSGYMDLRRNEGEVDILPNWALGALANFVKNLYSVLILSDGGLMLHAAGVVKDASAYIFFGPSESGKSTIARVSGNYPVLTDELVAIMCLNGSFKAYSTPFWGGGIKAGKWTNGSFEIGGLFKLIKDNEVYLKRLSYGQAIAEILTVPEFYDNLSSIERLFNSCMDLAKVIPCYELHFLPDSSFWRCIDEHIK